MTVTNSESCRRWAAKNPEHRRQRYLTKEKGVRRPSWRHKKLPAPTRPCPAVCECCGKPPTAGRALHLDHDHTTGAFRGWLCWRCNSGIGALGDSVLGILRALIYLIGCFQ